MTTPASGAELRDGRYVVTGLLGEGSQGATLEAVDKRDGRLVAIKRFEVRGARSWKEVELAEREARVLETLHHPGLPAHVDHFEEAGALYLVMDRVEGTALDRLRDRRELAEADVVALLADGAEVLAYLHGKAPPIIHRDVKPSNFIRRQSDGRFVLVDFGSVRDGLRPQGGSTVVGTFGYMAPEQIQGRALPATDVYGLGATALSLLTGVEPETLPHKGLAIDVRTALAGRCSEPLVHVLEAMLRPDPDERPSDVRDLVRGLRPAPRPERPRRAEARVGAASPAERPAEAPGRERVRGVRDPAWSRASSSPAGQSQAMVPRPREVPLVPRLVLLAVVLALGLARIAVALALGVFVPATFMVLSWLIGSPMRRAASQVRASGRQADRSLREAIARVRGERVGGWTVPPARVTGGEPPPPPRVRVAVDAEAPHEADVVERAERELDGAVEEIDRTADEIERTSRGRRSR